MDTFGGAWLGLAWLGSDNLLQLAQLEDQLGLEDTGSALVPMDLESFFSLLNRASCFTTRQQQSIAFVNLLHHRTVQTAHSGAMPSRLSYGEKKIWKKPKRRLVAMVIEKGYTRVLGIGSFWWEVLNACGQIRFNALDMRCDVG